MTNQKKFFWQFISVLFGALAGWGVGVTIRFYFIPVRFFTDWYAYAIMFGSVIIGAKIALILIKQLLKQIP